MNTETDPAVQRQADGISANWGLLGTILWGIGIALIFIVLQTITTFVIVLRGRHDVSEQELQGLLEAAQSSGVVFSVATLVTTVACVLLVVGVAKLKRGSNIQDYFALKPVPARSLMLWLGILIIFIALSDTLTYFLGKPIVPEVMTAAYNSADPVWLFWLALVVAAPVAEETFFRGFLFKGFVSSFMGPYGAIVIIAILWAAIHVQYDLYGIGTIFVMGLLFGFARMLTGSLVVPLALHAVANIVATTEAALLG